MVHQFVADNGRELSLKAEHVVMVERNGTTVGVMLTNGRMLEIEFAGESVRVDPDSSAYDKAITYASHCAIHIGEPREICDPWEVHSYRII